jgi:hypothetical protein
MADAASTNEITPPAVPLYGLTRWAHRLLPPPPLRCARIRAPLRGRQEPVDYLDNPPNGALNS